MIRDLFTDCDDAHDLVRWIAAAGAVTGLALEIYSVVKQVPFDIQAFGIGFCALLGGLGGGLALKSKEAPTEK